MRDCEGNEKWINLREYCDIRKIEDKEEEVLWCEEDLEEAKEKEFQSWKENQVYEEVQDQGQTTVSLRWVVTKKLKGGKMVTKARLVARGFEEGEVSEKEAPTCSAEGLRLCLAMSMMKDWVVKTLDVKTAYLQGGQIESVWKCT